MTQIYETLMHRWFQEVWNQGREDTVDELLTEDSVAHGLPGEAGGDMRGPEAFKQFLRKFRAAFPDLRIQVEDTLVAGDKIAVRCTVTGTHTGPGITAAPSGKSISIAGMAFV